MFTNFNDASPIVAILTIFLGGVVSVATPCVFPLIPVTLAAFGVNADTSRSRAFKLSLCYVAGIATTYTALGVFSAKTGYLFGSSLGNPWVVGFLSVFFLFLTLFTLDIINLSAAYKLQTSASKIGGKGFAGAYLMGTVSGFVAAPCVGPVLVLVLTIAAGSHNTLWGGLLLFTYSMGFGLPFLIVGTYSGLLYRLPRSGNWLNWVKYFIAVGCMMAMFFILHGIAPQVTFNLSREHDWLILVLIAVLSIAATMFAMRLGSSGLKFIATVTMALALFVAVLPPPAAAELGWAPSIEAAVANAKNSHKIAMVDLFAEWCAACKELDAKTFSDPQVKAALSNLSLGRVDFTSESPVTQALSEKYSVVGLPCLLFLDQNGNEIPSSRVEGFLPPAEFLKHLEGVKAPS